MSAGHHGCGRSSGILKKINLIAAPHVALPIEAAPLRPTTAVQHDIHQTPIRKRRSRPRIVSQLSPLFNPQPTRFDDNSPHIEVRTRTTKKRRSKRARIADEVDLHPSLASALAPHDHDCPGGDSNPHSLAATWPSTMRVCQFRHPGVIVGLPLLGRRVGSHRPKSYPEASDCLLTQP